MYESLGLVPFSFPSPPIFLNYLALIAQEMPRKLGLLPVCKSSKLRLSAACIQGTQVEVELSGIDRRAPPALVDRKEKL